MSLFEDIKQENPNAKDEDIRDYVLEEHSQVIADIKSDNPDVADEDIFQYISQETGVPVDILFPVEPVEPEKTKEELINEEFDLKRTQLQNAKKVVSELTVIDDDDKQNRLNLLDIQLNKLDQDKIDAIDKYQKDKATMDKFKYDQMEDERQRRIEEAKERQAESPFGQTYIDPYTQEEIELPPAEQGLIDVSIDMLPIGKLGFTASQVTKREQFLADVDGLIDDGLSDAARRIVKFVDKPPEEIASVLKDVPKDQQALVLANRYGALTQKMTEDAIQYDKRLQKITIDQINARTQDVKDTLGEADFTVVKDYTDDLFTKMRSMSSTVGKEVDATDILGDLKALKFETGILEEAMDRRIKNMIKQLKNKPNMTLDELLEFRQNINSNLGKTNLPYREKEQWRTLKGNIDNIISDSFPDQKTFIDDAINQYKRTADHEELLDIINKNTTSVGRGEGKYTAIDWDSAYKELVETQQNNPEMIRAMGIVSEYQKKFGNDKSLLSKIDPDRPDITNVFIPARVIAWFAKSIPFTERRDNYLIEKGIRKAIKASKDRVDFARNIFKSDNTPDNVKALIARNLDNMDDLSKKEAFKKKVIQKQIDDYKSKPLQIEYKPQAKPEYQKSAKKVDAERIQRAADTNLEIKKVDKEINRLNNELKSIGKSKLSKAKKKERTIQIEQSIRSEKARRVTLEKKLPKQ